MSRTDFAVLRAGSAGIDEEEMTDIIVDGTSMPS